MEVKGKRKPIGKNEGSQGKIEGLRGKEEEINEGIGRIKIMI